MLPSGIPFHVHLGIHYKCPAFAYWRELSSSGILEALYYCLFKGIIWDYDFHLPREAMEARSAHHERAKRTVFPAPFCPQIRVTGFPKWITALSCSAGPKLRIPTKAHVGVIDNTLCSTYFYLRLRSFTCFFIPLISNLSIDDISVMCKRKAANKQFSSLQHGTERDMRSSLRNSTPLERSRLTTPTEGAVSICRVFQIASGLFENGQ